jgi:hypothetical protein
MIQSAVLIIGAPRSGTTLLYRILSEVSSLWSIGYESKAIIEKHHHPGRKGWASGALEAADLTPDSQAAMLAAFTAQAAPGAYWRRVNRLREALRGLAWWRKVKSRSHSSASGAALSAAIPQGGLGVARWLTQAYRRLGGWVGEAPFRLLEKTPENCLRLPFLQALFPEIRIIYLTRDGRANVNSLMEGWRQPVLFPGYEVPLELSIPGDERGRWAFTLIPGWRELASSRLEEICAHQWIRCNEAVLAFWEMGQVPLHKVRYEDLIRAPLPTLAGIAAFLDVDFEDELGRFAGGLPQTNVVSEPAAAKWRRQNPEAIGRILPMIQPMMEALGYESSAA